MLAAPEVVDALHGSLRALSEEEFVSLLPHLRLAFADLAPKECDAVAQAVGRVLGGKAPAPVFSRDVSTLRRCYLNAKACNMPKDRVEAAIKRAMGKDTSNYEEIMYEGYAPHGIAVLVETATDNPTRTVANVRMHFTKGQGSLGTSGSVAFGFTHMSEFKIKSAGLNVDDLELDLIDTKSIGKSNLRVVVDAVNSVGGEAVPALLTALGVLQVVEIHCLPTGHFAHDPEPLPENLSDLVAAVRKHRAHLGIAVDPDVDRLAIVCEDGSLFGEEYTLVACADHVLASP